MWRRCCYTRHHASCQRARTQSATLDRAIAGQCCQLTDLTVLVMPLVVVFLMPVPATATGIAPAASPPASAGDDHAKDHRRDSNDLRTNGTSHVTLNDQQ